MSVSHMSGAHISGSDEGRPDVSDSPSVTYIARTPKIELSGEGKTIHELQSLSSSPGYQHSHYPSSRSPDLQSQGHTSYELS